MGLPSLLLKGKQLAKTGAMLGRAHAPGIMIGFSWLSYAASVIFAVQATPTAMDDIEEAGAETFWEKVQACWKDYIPSATSFAMGTAGMFGSHYLTGRRLHLLEGACSTGQAFAANYQQHVIDAIGEKKEKEIRDQIDAEYIEEHPLCSREVIVTGKGDSLCLDRYSGRYFMSNIESIRRAIVEANRQLLSEMWISLNEVYDLMDMMPIDAGYDNGFSVDDHPDVNFSTQLADDGRPCIVVSFSVLPHPDMTRMW